MFFELILLVVLCLVVRVLSTVYKWGVKDPRETRWDDICNEESTENNEHN